MRFLQTTRGRVLLVLGVATAAVTTAGAALFPTTDAAKQSAIRAAKVKVRTERTVAAPAATEIAAARELALRIAAANGEPSPRAIHLVPTTRGAANGLDTGATVNTDESVLMVSMQGDFVAKFASGPTHGFTPKGTFLTFTYDPASGAVLDMSVGPLRPNLAQLGEVIALQP